MLRGPLLRPPFFLRTKKITAEAVIKVEKSKCVPAFAFKYSHSGTRGSRQEGMPKPECCIDQILR